MPFRKLALASIVAIVPIAGASAQSPLPPTQVAPGHADPYAHDPYITSTGATVPRPGLPQSGLTTPQERAIQRQDKKIDNSICKGC